MLIIIEWLVSLPRELWSNLLWFPVAAGSCSLRLSKSWERAGVGLSKMLSSYNNIYMRMETFIEKLPLQQHLCKQPIQCAQDCTFRCLAKVLVSQSSQTNEASRKWRREASTKSPWRHLMTEQVTKTVRVWERQFQFPRPWPTSCIQDAEQGLWTGLWSLAKTSQLLDKSELILSELKIKRLSFKQLNS